MKMSMQSVLKIVLWLLLMMPLSEAAMTLQGPIQTKVSLGDEMQLSGTILETTDFLGLLKFDLKCNQQQTILIKSISIKANVQKNFIETIAVNQYLDGSCVVEAYLEANGQKIDTSQSSPFTLTQELLGDIKIDKTEVQLGEDITIQGVITRPDGTRVTGSAIIRLKRDESIYLQEVIAVQNGAFTFKYSTKDNPAGTYTIEIEVTDAYNNKQVFVVDDFTINDAITLLLQQQKTDFLPGEEIVIAGNALAGGINIKKGSITFMFENQEYEAEIAKGKFKVTLPIASTIKSGDHIITATAHDDFGNREKQEIKITITPIPTIIALTTNTDTLQPLEQLTIHPKLTDQGGDFIEADVFISLEDSEGDIVFEETIQNDQQTAITLPESAVPGAWLLKASAEGIEGEKIITVTQRQSKDFMLERTILTVVNKGNTEVKETISIAMMSAFNPENDRTITKKISLDPGERAKIDLAVGTAPGMYKVTVGEKSFLDVEITETKSALQFPLIYIALGLAIILLGWFFLKGRRGKKEMRPTAHQSAHQQKSPWQKRNYKPEQAAHRFEQNMQERAEHQRKSFRWSMQKKQKDEFVFEIQKKQPSGPGLPHQYAQQSKNAEKDSWYASSSLQMTQKEGGEEKKKSLFNLFD